MAIEAREIERRAETLSPALLAKMDAYWRAANYLSVGQIDLIDNPLLGEPLKLEHLKQRLLGHWGTTPGLNFVYVHLNRLIKERDLNVMFVTGPGHGGSGVVENTYLEGTYSELYPNVGRDEQGLRRLEHPHGLSDGDFDVLFTKDRPIIFAYHGYPWLIHRLTYRRTNQTRLHVRGYKENGTTTTPFDIAVLNDIDRFHLVGDVIDRVLQLGSRAAYAKQFLRDKLLEHRAYVDRHGVDLPEVRNWKSDAEPLVQGRNAAVHD